METLLKEALWAYIRDHNPELMYDLQENYAVSAYLDKKVGAVQGMAIELIVAEYPKYLIEARCMEVMTAELMPSRYLYLKGIFESEFEDEAALYGGSGILVCEVIGMLEHCKGVLDEMGFSVHNEEDPEIRNAVIGLLQGYLYAEHDE
ncbi:MAG: hypothetical protein ACLGH8_15020 [Bacteroidia bacterium]